MCYVTLCIKKFNQGVKLHQTLVISDLEYGTFLIGNGAVFAPRSFTQGLKLKMVYFTMLQCSDLQISGS